MMGALGQYLVLDLDRGETGRLDHIDGPVQMHRIAPSAAAVEDQRQPAYCADVHADAHHLGKRQVRLGDALDIAECTAA